MVRIYVVDNGGQWTHREWRTLRDLDVETAIVPNTTPFKVLVKEKIQGLVLSGGAPRIGLDSTLGNCGEYLEKDSYSNSWYLRRTSVYGSIFRWRC